MKISPSILSANFAKLGEEVTAICKAGCDYVHVDVMDGNFVPNITIGPLVIKSVKEYAEKVPFDVHLMIQNPDNYVEQFVEAGADMLTIHPEATIHLDRSLDKIRSLGVKSGVSLNPSTHEDTIEYVMEKIDLILIMTVNPGFGGQKFLHSQLHKIENLKNRIVKNGYKIDISVDGGITDQTVKLVKNAGADIVVSGNYIFNHPSKSYKTAIESLKD